MKITFQDYTYSVKKNFKITNWKKHTIFTNKTETDLIFTFYFHTKVFDFNLTKPNLIEGIIMTANINLKLQ